MSGWLFPPQTQEAQFDEKWAFVGKKQARCDPENPQGRPQGRLLGSLAFAPEHRLVLAFWPGARSIENAEAIVEEVKQRVNSDGLPLLTSDEYPAYESAIVATFGEPVPAPGGPGRPRIIAERTVPEKVIYATVHKRR